MPSYCRQGVCLAGFEVAIQCKSENGKRRKRKEQTGNEASCERYCGDDFVLFGCCWRSLLEQRWSAWKPCGVNSGS